MTLGIAGVIKPSQEVGDAEVCAYLYTASLTAPMPHHLNQIYIYVTATLLKRRGRDLTDFMKKKLEEGLTSDEDREYRNLKRDLYTRRGGEISHPILNILRQMKKGRRRKPSSPQLRRAA